MASDGSVRVVVRSRRIPVRTISVRSPIYSPTGVLLGNSTSLGVVYGSDLDEPHIRAIEEGRRLSCNLGLEFEVVDRSRGGLLSRLASRITSRPTVQPSLVLIPAPAGRGC